MQLAEFTKIYHELFKIPFFFAFDHESEPLLNLPKWENHIHAQSNNKC